MRIKLGALAEVKFKTEDMRADPRRNAFAHSVVHAMLRERQAAHGEVR